MPKFNEDWIVQPHGDLERLADGLLTVCGEIVMPLGRFPRRMTVAVLTGGRTAIWSPMPVAEPQMRQIEALGEVAFLIVPGVGHRLDIRAWKARYPKALVVCPPGAKSAVEEATPVDAVGDVLGDPNVRLEAAPGVGEMEAVLRVTRAGRTTLVLNDLLANVRHPHGLGAKIMARIFDFGVKRPQIPKVCRKMFVKDAAALSAAFRGWSQDPTIARVVVSHGDVIEAPSKALGQAARDLAE